MVKNMGNADRVIRTVIAAFILLLGYYGAFTGSLRIVLLVVAGIFLLTSFFGICPLYRLLNINTCAHRDRA